MPTDPLEVQGRPGAPDMFLGARFRGVGAQEFDSTTDDWARYGYLVPDTRRCHVSIAVSLARPCRVETSIPQEFPRNIAWAPWNSGSPFLVILINKVINQPTIISQLCKMRSKR